MTGKRAGSSSRFPLRRGSRYQGAQRQQGSGEHGPNWTRRFEISNRELQIRTRDLIGDHGAPFRDPGFEIRPHFALSFDGVDDYLQIGGPGVATYGGPGGVTLKVRFAPRSAGTLLIAVVREPERDPEWRVRFLVDVSDAGLVRLHRGGAPDLFSVRPVPRDRALDLVVALGAESSRMFFDDEQVGADRQGAVLPGTETVFLVGGGATPKRTHPFLSCVLHELVVSRGLYRGSDANTESSPLEVLGHWKFDRGAGDRVPDLTSHGNPALLGAGGDRPAWSLERARIGAGRYYVDGLLAELEEEVDFTAQRDFPGARLCSLEGKAGALVFYLDVWERPVTAVSGQSPPERASGGRETPFRSARVAQVRCLPISRPEEPAPWDPLEVWEKSVTKQPRRGGLAVRQSESSAAASGDLWYRVEIHSSGVAQGDPGVGDPAAFKWSRHSTSQGLPVHRVVAGATVLDPIGRSRQGNELERGVWVELADDVSTSSGAAANLFRIKHVNSVTGQITLDRPVPEALESDPFIRRWDPSAGTRADGTMPAMSDAWTELEAGLEVRFERGQPYLAGDFWQFPARSVARAGESSGGDGSPRFATPQGVQHHYCVLAVLEDHSDGFELRDCRTIFPPLTRERSDLHSGDQAAPEATSGRPDLDTPAEGGDIAEEPLSDTGEAEAPTEALPAPVERAPAPTAPTVEGVAILAPTPEPADGFAYTGSKLELANPEPSWLLTLGARTTGGARLHLSAAETGLYVLAESGEFWRLDPESNVWSGLSPMPEPRDEFALARVGGKVFAVGGRDSRGELLGSVLAYDIASNIWTAVRDMPTPRARLAVAVAGGRLSAVGGLQKRLWSEVSTGTVEVYDPQTDTWRRGPSMPAPRHDLGAAVLSGRIHSLGGARKFLFGFLGNMVTGTHQVLDPIAGAWSRAHPDLPVPRVRGSVAVVAERVYVLGGEGPLGTHEDVEVLDVSRGAWSRMPSRPEMVEAAAGSGSDGRLFLVGRRGEEGSGEFVMQSCSVATTFYVHRELPRGGIPHAEATEESGK